MARPGHCWPVRVAPRSPCTFFETSSSPRGLAVPRSLGASAGSPPPSAAGVLLRGVEFFVNSLEQMSVSALVSRQGDSPMLAPNLPNSVAAAIIAENDRLRRASVEILLETAALQEKLGSRSSEPALGRIGSDAS